MGLFNRISDAAGVRGGWRAWLLYPPGPGPQLMSWLRRQFVVLRNPKARITFGIGVYIGPGFSVDAPDGGEFIAGDGCELRRNVRIELDGPAARVEIGAHSILTNGVLIQCAAEVMIGADCQFDHAVLLVDGQHNLRKLGTAPPPSTDATPLLIGDHVTVTSSSTVAASIGHHSLVGANSVVLKELPPHCLAAGSPAQVIGRYGPNAGWRN